MMRIIDLEIGTEVQVETGYTNWNRADDEFYCTVSGISEDGMVILDAKNSVCFDGRNKIQPFFVVDRNTMIERATSYNTIPGCYVLWHIIGMDRNGRFILKTQTKQSEI